MRKKLGGNKEVFRRRNRGLLIKLLATGQCTTRAELSRTMGLSKMAISNMVTELIDQNIIEESNVKKNEELGRNPISLIISPKSPKTIGILIFRNRCEAILCDLSLAVLKRKRISMKFATNDTLINTVYDLVDAMLEEKEVIIGIGVASIGPIDVNRGMILKPEFFYDIENVPLVELMKERYKLPVYFDNDNLCGALAEKLFGNGKEFHDIILLGLGQGVGCGIIIDDELYNNSNELIPEFGHISIDYNGHQCICGNKGCIETYVRTPVLLDKMRVATGKNYSFKDFCEMETCKEIDDIMIDAVKKLSVAIVNTVNLLNTELILLGYDGIFLPDKYIELLENEINSKKFTDDFFHVYVKKPYFLKDSQLFGAACNVITQVFSGELLFD